MIYDSHQRSMMKSLVWRLLGVIILAAITYFYTRSWMLTSIVTFIHHGSFLLIFYLHERFWLKVRWFSKWKHIAKAFTYEIILGNLVLGTITWLVTGNWKAVTAITFTYIGIKLVMYPIYDFVWKIRVVYAYLVGDIIHIGHLRALENAKRQGDYVIAGVLTDEATMEKKPKPIIPFPQRLKTVAAMTKYVNEVVPQYSYSPLDNVKRLKPDVLMECDRHDEQPANKYVESYGGKIVVTPYFHPVSSTKIKEKIKRGGNKDKEWEYP